MISDYWLTIAIIICVSTDVLMNFLVVIFVRKLTLRHGFTLDLMKVSNKVLKKLPEMLSKSLGGTIGYYQGKAVKTAKESLGQADGLMGEVKSVLNMVSELQSPNGLNQAPTPPYQEEYDIERRM